MEGANDSVPLSDKCMQIVLEDRSPPQAINYSLCGKPSFFVCKGKKSPDLNEVNSSTDLRQLPVAGAPAAFSYEKAAWKVKDIIKCQQHIIGMVSNAKEKVIEKKDWQEEAMNNK